MPNTTERSQYRTGRTLSSGTHATLKEAIHIKTGRYYACKVISKDGTEGWEHLVRNEIAVLKRVQGGAANIIKLHDYFQTAHSVYLCLDLCIGGTLWDRIRDKGTYSEGKAVDLMRTLFIAIKHIHDAGVVHRDLRPENLIFRTADDAAPVMVAGFGLSRMMEDASHLPKEMEIASAPRYAAPEILSLLKNGEDKPVDVYGLGIIAYFVIAGCTPFERDTTQSEVQAVLAGQYKFGPDNKWDKVSANAREFIALCLAFDPIRRPKAREALAKPWIAQRLALRTSRRSSLLDLAGLRAFNPKRKWRILGLTIKALSRMHNLARPSTQKDLQQDSLHSYRHSKDLESKLGEADSSPVSSVYSFSDQGSSLRRDSISTMTTEDDTASIRDDDSSRESFIPTLAASDPQSLVAAHATVDPSLSEHHSDQQTPQEHPPPPSTQISSSTASSLSDQNFQEAVGTESNASPQSAADAHISTFVIYTPEKMDKISNDREVPITPEDIKVVESSFPDGGLVVSVHRPTEAEAWVEDHYEDNVFQSARSSGLVGPIAAMLSPDVPALVIFGSILDDRVLSFAKTLANVSGFAVMIRPIGDDPVSTFSEPDESEEPIPRMPSSLSSESEEEGGNGDENDVTNPGDSSLEGPALRLRGGRGDDSDDDDDSLPWVSKAHEAAVWLKLWPDEEHKYDLNILTETRFQLQSKYEEDRLETRPEVIGRVSLTVETRNRISPDRSYTSLGFLAHRESSIIKRDFIDCGFDYPDQTVKSIDQTAKGISATVSAGYMNLHPVAGAGATFSKTDTETQELADNKTTPRCLVFHDPGERWNGNGKSYTSYDITTVPGQQPRTGMKHPLKATFAMGINIRPIENEALPKMSFITRNQVILWISDTTMKSRVRGLLVLTTTYIPNIRTPKELFVLEELDVHFKNDVDTPDNIPQPGDETMALSLSIAPIKTKKSRKNSITELFADVRRKLSPNKEPTLADLPLTEYISRGWDPTNNVWRSAVWTSLDRNFRTTQLEKAQTTPVWRLGWNPRRHEDNDSDGSEGPGNDVVDPVDEVVPMND